MRNKDEETRILSELADKPVHWFIERPEKVNRLREWQFELPMWYWKDKLLSKYYAVLRAAGLARCNYCGEWVEASRLVRVETWYFNPGSPGCTPCCEGTCEIELLRSN